MSPHHKCIIFTGPPGCGKTTLVKRICRALQQKQCELNGFFTEEIRERGERIGFDVVLCDGRRGTLARVNSFSTKAPKVGKYFINLKSFEDLCIPEFSEKNKNGILVLDEIGKMELLSSAFKNKVRNIFQMNDRIVLGTIPVETRCADPLLCTIRSHPDTLLISVNKDNRDSLVEKICSYIIEMNAFFRSGT